jgi:hypothetical protein
MIYAWNAANGQQIFTFTSAMEGYSASFPSIPTWSPDGQNCAISYSNGNKSNGNKYIAFTVLRANDGKQLFQKFLPNPDYNVAPNMVWSPDSQYFAFPDASEWLGGKPWSAGIWDSKTYQRISSFGAILPAGAYPPLSTDPITFIAWSPGGQNLATYVIGFIYISRFGNNQPVKELPTYEFFSDLIDTFVWSPNEKYLAVFAQQSLTILDTSNGQPVPINGNNINDSRSQGSIAGFAWSADSQSITIADIHNVLTQLQIG